MKTREDFLHIRTRDKLLKLVKQDLSIPGHALQAALLLSVELYLEHKPQQQSLEDFLEGCAIAYEIIDTENWFMSQINQKQ